MNRPVQVRRFVVLDAAQPARSLNPFSRFIRTSRHDRICNTLARMSAPAGPLSVMTNCGLLVFAGRAAAYEELSKPHVFAHDLWAGSITFDARAGLVDRGTPIIRARLFEAMEEFNRFFSRVYGEL